MRRFALAVLLLSCGAPEGAPELPDLRVVGARIWTGDARRPWAEWATVRGDRFEQVGSGAAPEAKETSDFGGRLVVPGFNDSHVHFERAGDLLLGVNLLDISDDEKFRSRIAEAAARLPAGSWITGGDWGAYEAWEAGSDGKARGETRYVPRRQLIDEVIPGHPVLVTRFDRKMGLANRAALRALEMESPDGLLQGDALAEALQRVPRKSFERRLAEARRALEECRRWGVTSVQDMSPLDQVEVYEWLRRSGELTCRIHFSPARLSDAPLMIRKGWIVRRDDGRPRPPGDEWIRFGTVKSHVDGIMGGHTARFFEPYDDRPDTRGDWREFSRDLAKFEEMLREADQAGIQLRVHAIGDEANALLLAMLERMEPRDRRFRLVHAQVFRARDFARLRGLGVVAEVQPFHCIDDMRWMEERIGRERCRGAYAFRSLLDAGCILAFGSDWPGTNASYYPVNPLLGIYAAVTRRTVRGTPPGGWFPEQQIPLEDAMRAYTWGGAHASFEEQLKGTIEPGKLADFAVLDTDIFEAPVEKWLEAKVDVTVVAGRVVFRR